MVSWATALAWALKHWRAVAGGIVLAILLLDLTVARGEVRHYKKLYTAEKTANDMLANTYRLASEKARADAEANARSTEQHYAEIQKEQSDALHVQLADARALAARYASLHRASGTDQGQPGKADLSGAPEPASGPDGSGEQAVLVTAGDLDTCTVNTVKAEQWREWWLKVSADSAR